MTAFGLFLPYLLAILFGQLLSFRCYKIKMAIFRHPSWRSSARCSINSGPPRHIFNRATKPRAKVPL